MTELEIRQIFLNAARGFLGCKEADGSHCKIIDLYNTLFPLPRNYRMQYDDPWCATFPSAVAVKCGMTKIIPCECSCYYMVEGFKALGRWVEDDGYTPLPGDIIFYDWEDSGRGDCLGVPDHVGIVEEVDGDNLTIIEGNISDSVGRRAIKVNNRYIRGYGVPDYASLVSALDIGTPSEWARESCYKAVKGGIFHGDENGEFHWQDSITREELAVVLDNMGLLG